ncbi:hypothetical protein DVS77_13450 [Mycolicibacterium moriokaense]|nr:hypothetical protein DVS77_13450 [Mycolicibacterium moriokaense]
MISAATVMAAAVMSSSAGAAAAPTGTGSAGDVVQSLKSQGYSVVINGATNGRLSDCTVTGVHNPDRSGSAVAFTTVYVDVDCAGADT